MSTSYNPQNNIIHLNEQKMVFQERFDSTVLSGESFTSGDHLDGEEESCLPNYQVRTRFGTRIWYTIVFSKGSTK